ncbi:hypothetical protein PybrP1_007665, partial [[Pythium] brassicae (nom. inval.)]
MSDQTIFEGHVNFPSRGDDSYRYKITATSDTASFWIEDRKTKNQWSSGDLKIADFVSVNNMIPGATMADYVSFVLALKSCASVWRPTYEMTLKSIPLQPIDILAAQLRDVQDELSKHQLEDHGLPRVRKSWENYSSTEKTLYLNAVALAMRSGLHQKFVQLHVEYFSELEAHRNCMFIYWHRMYLLGYENLLRSQGSGYECVTLPVWDHLAATARRTTGSCQYMEDCAPIVSDFGGSTQGSVKNLLIYNETIGSSSSELCVNRGVVANFCGNNTACAGCVVRGSAASTRYPGDAFFASVYTQVFSYSTWDNFRS